MQLWKITTDLGLLLSILYFGYRFLKNQAPAVNHSELESLNNSLKSAIRDADESTKNLSEQLQKRKQALEKLMFDLETVEHRINRAITTAEERKGELDIAIRRARQSEIKEDVLVDFAAEKTTSQIEIAVPVQEIAFTEEALNAREEKQKPTKDTEEKLGRIEAVRAARAYKAQKTMGSETNVFGEPIEADSKAGFFSDDTVVTSYQPLSAHIEKKVEMPGANDKDLSLEKSIEDIYASAEDLIRAGKSLEAVSVSTKLSLDELKLISRMIEQDDAMRKDMVDQNNDDAANIELTPKNVDQRLGVLGSSRRQSQVI